MNFEKSAVSEFNVGPYVSTDYMKNLEKTRKYDALSSFIPSRPIRNAGSSHFGAYPMKPNYNNEKGYMPQQNKQYQLSHQQNMRDAAADDDFKQILMETKKRSEINNSGKKVNQTKKWRSLSSPSSSSDDDKHNSNYVFQSRHKHYKRSQKSSVSGRSDRVPPFQISLRNRIGLRSTSSSSSSSSWSSEDSLPSKRQQERKHSDFSSVPMSFKKKNQPVKYPESLGASSSSSSSSSEISYSHYRTPLPTKKKMNKTTVYHKEDSKKQSNKHQRRNYLESLEASSSSSSLDILNNTNSNWESEPIKKPKDLHLHKQRKSNWPPPDMIKSKKKKSKSTKKAR